MPEFEFDPLKSTKNKIKHGIDFDQAKEIWNGNKRVEAPARSLSEARFMVIGKAIGKLWSAFVTYRGVNIRIISVRRARDSERKYYEEVE